MHVHVHGGWDFGCGRVLFDLVIQQTVPQRFKDVYADEIKGWAARNNIILRPASDIKVCILIKLFLEGELYIDNIVDETKLLDNV